MLAAVLALYLLPLLAAAAASVKVAHPAQDQLPLVARTGQPYSWALRNDTFLPPPSTPVTAHDLPAWLSFDGATLTFTGTVPAAADIPEGELAPITLNAGSGVKDTLVLYVSSLEPPALAKPIAGQLRPHAPPLASVFLLNAGSALLPPAASFERGLRVPPGWSFSIGWDGDTFAFPGGDDVFYAARLANNDPLPGWMTYDRYTMTFVGVAPNLASPTRFDIVLYGGDAKGYQAVHDSFALVVAAHELAWAPPTELSVGAPLFADVLYDGEPLTGDVKPTYTVESSVGWLTFNATTQTLVGAPPAGFSGAVSARASITVGGQTVRVDVPVDVPGLSSPTGTGALAPLVVRPGADVDYDLGAGTRVTGPVQGAPWLHADGGSHLKGAAPADAGSVVASVPVLGQPGPLKINVTVTPDAPHDSKKFGGGGHGPGINKSVLAACVGALLGFALLCTVAACCRKCCAVREDVRPGSPRVRDLEYGEKALDRAISSSSTSTISGKAAKVLGIESPALLPSLPSGKPAPTAVEVKAQPTSSAKSAFFRRLRDWQERNGPMAPDAPLGAPSVRVHVQEDEEEDPYEGVVELSKDGLEASPSGSTVTGRSAVSYDYTTDTSSTISEPLEAERETPRRRRDFGPDIIRTAARVTRAGTFVAEGTPELVSGVRLVSLSGVVVESAPRLATPVAMGRGVAATPSPDPRLRAFAQMQLVEPTTPAAARESTLSYLTTTSAGEDADADEDEDVARARQALHMGRGAALR